MNWKFYLAILIVAVLLYFRPIQLRAANNVKPSITFENSDIILHSNEKGINSNLEFFTEDNPNHSVCVNGN